jgi:ABC-type phosphate/phosphonate transport system substrate-binding protein
MQSRILMVLVLAVGNSVTLSATEPEIVRIGIMGSIAQGNSPRLQQALAPEFGKLVRQFTGLKSVTLQGLDPFTAARQLETGKWHLGIFQGVEFAWVRARYRDLEPLMIVAFEEGDLRAALVVKKDRDFKSFEDLKGKSVCVLQAKLHCRLFADKAARGRAQDLFGKVYQALSGEDALDNVLRGKYDAAIVDTPILKLYKDVAPGRYKHLRVLAQSEVFPPAAAVYRKGALDEPLLKTLRAGMLKANQNEEGREAMNTFQIKGFRPVPADYEQALSDIRKAYPPPPE